MSQNGATEDLEQAQPQDLSLRAEPKSRLDSPTAEATVLCGQQAWQRLRREQTWDDWKRVGAALVIGRNGAMREAGANRPAGHRYNATFTAWLKKFDFERLDKADRSRLFGVMDHLPEIETWRATLTPAQGLRLNHPSAVLRKWKAATATAPNQNSRVTPLTKCRAEKSALQQEILRLRRDGERCDGDRWQPADRPEAIATAMLAKLGRDKAAAVAGAILKVLEEKEEKIVG